MLIMRDIVGAAFMNRLIGVRPQDVKLASGGETYTLSGMITDQFDIPDAAKSLITASVNGEDFYAYIDHPNQRLTGTHAFTLKRFYVFDAQTERLVERIET